MAAGYSDCCEDGICLGHILDCFCDEFCYNFDDCCNDVADICSIGNNNVFLLFILVTMLSSIFFIFHLDTMYNRGTTW